MAAEDSPLGLSVTVDLTRQAGKLSRPKALLAELLPEEDYVETAPHLTLAVLSEKKQLREMGRRLGEVAANTRPFPLVLRNKIISLRCRSNPCEFALAVVATRSPELMRLYRSVHRSLRRLEQSEPHIAPRDWQPHVALAYVTGLAEEEIPGILRALEEVSSRLVLEVDNIEVSHLSPRGRWRRLATFPLAGYVSEPS